MNKEQFRLSTKESITDPKTIVNLMKILYEADIIGFFPLNIWNKGNPIINTYNDIMKSKDFYSLNGKNRLYYKHIVMDIKDNKRMSQGIKEDIAFYIANSSQIFLPSIYNRKV